MTQAKQATVFFLRVNKSKCRSNLDKRNICDVTNFEIMSIQCFPATLRLMKGKI